MKKLRMNRVELAVLLTLAMVCVLLLMPATRMALAQDTKTSCQNNLKHWGIICKMFANEQKDALYPSPMRYHTMGRRMPRGFAAEELYPDYRNDPRVAVRPADPRMDSPLPDQRTGVERDLANQLRAVSARGSDEAAKKACLYTVLSQPISYIYAGYATTSMPEFADAVLRHIEDSPALKDASFLDDLSALGDAEQQLLAGAMIPYKASIEEAQRLILRGDYDAATVSLELLRDNPPGGIHAAMIDRLLKIAKTLKRWQKIPESIYREIVNEMGDKGQIAFLQDIVSSDDDLDRQMVAAQLLAKNGSDEAFEALRNARMNVSVIKPKTEYEDYLIGTFDTLFMQNEQCVSYMVSLVDTPDSFSSKDRMLNDLTTVWILARIGTPEALDGLIRIGANPRYSAEKRKFAIEAAGFTCSDDAPEKILKLIREGMESGASEDILVQAAKSLAYTGSREVLPVVGTLLPMASGMNAFQKELVVSLNTIVVLHGDYFATTPSALKEARSLIVKYYQ